tara:strand:+ start:204 stop:1451 length:1248 start_codon:yes stop_codon:yes gene_type:complete
MEARKYSEFEDKFRGSTKDVQQRLSIYDSLLSQISLNLSSSQLNILDLGSGRGEWLQRCRSKNYKCIGIEQNSEMLKNSMYEGINFIEGDIFQVMKNLQSDSFDVLTAFHIIEHLSPTKICILFDEIFRLLNSNGVLIIETPSIDNLSIASKGFYLDPTHITPINEELVCFQLSNAGFNEVHSYYINAGPLKNTRRFALTRILNGVSQDLCLIASKGESSTQELFYQNSSWQKDLDCGPTTIEAASHFDNYTDELEFKLNKSMEDIFLLKKELLILKKELRPIISRNHKLNNFLLFRIIRKSRKIFSFLFVNSIKKIFSASLAITHLINKISFLRLFLFLAKYKIFFITLTKILKLIGLSSYTFKLQSVLNKTQITGQRSSNNNNKLQGYYDSHKIPSKILDDILSKVANGKKKE